MFEPLFHIRLPVFPSATYLVILFVASASMTCADDAANRAIAPNAPTPAGNAIPEVSLVAAFPGLPDGSFGVQPVWLTYPPDGTDRVAVVEQDGEAFILKSDPATTEISSFLDIRGRVSRAGREEGLLGLAFHPDFATNGEFYVYYSASNPRRSVISRFTVPVGSGPLARAAPDSEEIILEVPQPFSNHNGGALIFGPDGYLYVGLGDGGSRGDPRGNDQNTGTLLGSILRLDVDGVAGDRNYAIPPDNPFVGDPDSRDEIWAFGMRNPWRISFDRQTDDLWAGDVGQNVWEEVDVIVAGGNYGWNVTEGAHCYRPSTNCATGGLIPPVQEYDHGSGCSITGGYVYRGEALPSLAGVYLYADFCSGRIWGLRYEDGAATVTREIANTGLPIASFGEDAAGELYVLAFDGGVYRVVAASE